MTKKEKNIIMNFAVKKINREEMLLQLNLDESKLNEFILSSLLRGLTEKNSDDIEYAFYIEYDMPFSDKLLDILCKLITEDWHISHESIAFMLQHFRSPKSVDCLYKAILIANQIEYLQYNEGESFIVKCAWALGDINTDYAYKKLEELSISSNNIIKQAAEFQLGRKR